MKILALIAAAAPFFCAAAFAQVQPSESNLATVFVGVNLLPMDSDRVVRNQNVLVAHGKIVAIGASVPVPTEARIVDGHGTSFLSPGLADMHVHSDTSRAMAVFLAYGEIGRAHV